MLECMQHYYPEAKTKLFSLFEINLDDCIELKYKLSYENNYIGKIHYYYPPSDTIYLWNLVLKSWNLVSVGINNQLHINMFSNSTVFDRSVEINKNKYPAKKYIDGTLIDFGIEISDLEESPIRFRDGRIHYTHIPTGTKYSRKIRDKEIYQKVITEDKKELEALPNKLAESFQSLDINSNDLIELPMRFRDGSVHYRHKHTNNIYSKNMQSVSWYVPSDAVQKQIIYSLQHI